MHCCNQLFLDVFSAHERNQRKSIVNHVTIISVIEIFKRNLYELKGICVVLFKWCLYSLVSCDFRLHSLLFIFSCFKEFSLFWARKLSQINFHFPQPSIFTVDYQIFERQQSERLNRTIRIHPWNCVWKKFKFKITNGISLLKFSIKFYDLFFCF